MTVQGGITMPIFHCLFNGNGTITSYMTAFDVDMYQVLDNLYLICISLNEGSKKSIVAGMAIKTSYKHSESEFLNALNGLLLSTRELKKYASENISFLPAKIGVEGKPPSESELLRLMQNQYLKHCSVGNA